MLTESLARRITNPLFGQYTYRDSPKPEVDVDLFPARLKIENDQQLVSAGLRFGF